MENNIPGLSDFLTMVGDEGLREQRTITISEGISSSVSRRVCQQLLKLEADAPGKPIYIYQNSPGGEVNSGYAIFDMIRFISSEVKIINCGLCASIATVINVAAKKENRFSTPNSKFLIHQPLISGVVRGQASDLEITAKSIIKTREQINKLLAEECGQPLERVENDTKRDYWMDAGEALEYGLVSKIISSQKEL
ncbi:ATP-dependent Clp protease proteolytic subunit [Oligoflexaceae bacterium]|nr:ATP-dependent Clp protease proteolytic subunit [Oligoflexaceae bacterium]